jgi:hypothetical protein
MSMLSDDINSQISAGRRRIEHQLDEMRDIQLPRVPPAVVAAGVITGVLAIGLVGWMVYRSRRRRTLVQRLQDALPDSVRELPQELHSRVRRAK